MLCHCEFTSACRRANVTLLPLCLLVPFAELGNGSVDRDLHSAVARRSWQEKVDGQQCPSFQVSIDRQRERGREKEEERKKDSKS